MTTLKKGRRLSALLLSFAMLLTLLPTAALAEPVNKPVLTATANNEKNYVELSWTSTMPSSHFMIYQKDDDGTDEYQTIPAKSDVKVLNVFPDVTGSDKLKEWMETTVEGETYTMGSPIIDGVQHTMTVDKVSLTDFNNAPDVYLQNEDGTYSYDVVYFGAWDSNNYLDLSDEGYAAARSFIDYGGGMLLGHDTVANLAPPGHPNFMKFQTDLNLQAHPWNGNDYGGNFVVVYKKGLLTNFPYSLGDVGSVLIVPGSHNFYQYASGDIWFRYGDASGNAAVATHNFYLTTWNNSAMIQTGHSGGDSSIDEQKILTNTLYYLAQITTANASADRMSQDLAAPDAVSADTLSSDGTAISWTAPADNGSSYRYKLKEISADGSVVVESDEAGATVTTGVDRYIVLIDENETASASAVKAGGTVSTTPSFDISGLTPGTNYYVHIVAVDKAGNESAVSDAALPDPNAVAPIIATQPVDETVTIGENAEFSVAVSAPQSGISYQWQTKVDDEWINIADETSATLSIESVTAANDGAKYRCVVTHTVGESHESTISDEATLHVVYPVTVNIFIDGVPAAAPGAVTFKQGEVTKATADSSATGVYASSLSNGTYEVYVNGEDIGVEVTVDGAATSADAVNYYTVSYAVQDSGLATGSTVSATAGGVSIASGAVVLAGKPIVITAAGAGANSYTYLWSGDGTNGQTTDTLSVTLTGKINALGTVAGSNSYAVALNTNGGTINSGHITSYDYGAPVALPTDVTRANATFAGWYESEDFSGDPVTQIAASATGPKSFYAKWTNTVTYSYNYSGAGDYITQPDALHGAVPAFPNAPVREGYSFVGWYKDAAGTNPWRIQDTLTGDVTLYARWSAAAYSVTGKVVDDTAPTPNNVAGATVKMIQGNVQFGTTATTDANGNFTVTGVPNGIYNLVVTKDDRSVTLYVRVNNGNYDFADEWIVLPVGNKNSQLQVKGADTPSVVVDGLNELFNDPNSYTNDDRDLVANGGTVVINLEVEKLDENTADGAPELRTLAAGQTIAMFLDMTLSKRRNNDAPTQLTTVGSLLKIIVPYDLSGKANVAVYRYHAGTAETMTKLAYSETAPASEGYMLDTSGNRIIVWAQNFSTYAIAYTPVSSSSGSSGGSGSSSYTITVNESKGGSISPSGSISAAYGSSKTFTITPDEGYVIADVIVDGKSVGAVGSYTLSNITGPHTISVVFKKADKADKGLPYYYNDSGKKVFIGFASDRSGTMKYIAPPGETVLFQENPKSFTDIANHWGKSYIDFVTEREIFVGTSDSVFSPDTGMTRAMLATVIGRLYERSYGPLQTAATHTFTDCSDNNWYCSYIDWSSEKGIILGVGGGKFEPNRQVTRQEMAAMLYRFAKFMKLSTEIGAGAKLNYSDADDIAPWAREASLYFQETGIITGRDQDSFVPEGTATRAEVATILKRFIEVVV